ncbi:hypothetical protein C8A00DRAFT_15214 [Chaetomidium leptoderma]|uniref:Uncharacterized protein n=1 Tax=Chaetomidium leptoderma TaxID=669021 RepID=A0AAN6ZVK4_9PEZI|nr:hypothetical protein C8A00DRAFT_15214 [Chaetomidium leptoderma]
MCLTKVYYNTYSDGSQDITEKSHPCRDGRSCSHPDLRRYDRKFPFTKLGDAQPEDHRSLSERKPTPYFTGNTPRGSKSPSPSGRRDSGVYMSGANASKHYDYRDPYGGYDAYGYQPPSRHDPRDRYDREQERESRRLKRSSTAPHIVYMDRDGKPSRSRSHSSSRDYSRDIPLGLVPLADEYGRRHSLSSRSRSRDEGGHSNNSREGSDHSRHHRRRTDDPLGYVRMDDDDERRRQRRSQRRMSTSSYPEPSTSAGGGMMDTYDTSQQRAYLPRRASTVVHHSDGSISTGSGGGGSGSAARPKQLRWDDQVRAKRDRQNAEIASRSYPGEVKGILKHTTTTGGDSSAKGKGKGREAADDVEELRRSVAGMGIPRGRDREPRGGRDEWGRYDEELGRERRKRSKVYGDERYRY